MTFTEAASRRDFTINAMGWEPFKKIALLDPYLGRADIRDAGRSVTSRQRSRRTRYACSAASNWRNAPCVWPPRRRSSQSIAHEFRHLPAERIWGGWEKVATKARRPGMSLDALRASGSMQHHPELAAIENPPQDPTWHPEGAVEVHTAEAIDAAARWCDDRSIGGTERMIAVLGALVHDLGKATHTQIHHDGRVTSYGHARGGRRAGEDLRSMGAPSRVVTVLIPIVREHMCVACAPEQVTPGCSPPTCTSSGARDDGAMGERRGGRSPRPRDCIEGRDLRPVDAVGPRIVRRADGATADLERRDADESRVEAGEGVRSDHRGIESGAGRRRDLR